MKTPHFFKAYSRIGLKNIPYRMKSRNDGVESGPDAILDKKFLSNFEEYDISKFRFSFPEDIRSKEFNQRLAGEMLVFKSQILIELSSGETPVIIGGDHSVTFSSIAASLEMVPPRKLGYIHIDSHPDANLSATSPTQNFHGMYLRPFLTEFDIPEINSIITKKLLPENVLFIGNLDIDPGERFLFDDLGILNFNGKNIKGEKVLDILNKFLADKDLIHINLDIDVFDKSLAPATGIPSENGLFLEDLIPLFEIIKDYPNLMLDLVEVNPKKKGGEKTIKLAQEVLQFMLK